ncbi:MAG: flippase-like domain-containing protein [Alphaproteobacteria bacterium]|nr:flippase-like domain-containing protein [Alphaproteobacteria bacterium SS10]
MSNTDAILEGKDEDDAVATPSVSERPQRLRNALILIVQIAVSIGLLAWVLSDVDIASLGNAIAGLNPWFMIAAAAVLPLHIPANAWRWRYVWPPGNQSPSLATLSHLITIGLFFNQVLPPPVGGDAVRTVAARRYGCSLPTAALSILIERTWGLIVVTLMILPTLPLLMPNQLPSGQSPWTSAALLTLLAGLGLVATFYIFLWGCRRLEARLQRPLILKLLEQWRVSTLQPGRAIVLLMLSVIGQAPPIIAIVLIAMALPVGIDPTSALLVAPLALFATVIPLSFAGWGVREGVMVTALAGLGVNSAAALSLSLTFGMLLLLISLPGALLWQWRRPVKG